MGGSRGAAPWVRWGPAAPLKSCSCVCRSSPARTGGMWLSILSCAQPRHSRSQLRLNRRLPANCSGYTHAQGGNPTRRSRIRIPARRGHQSDVEWVVGRCCPPIHDHRRQPSGGRDKPENCSNECEECSAKIKPLIHDTARFGAQSVSLWGSIWTSRSYRRSLLRDVMGTSKPIMIVSDTLAP
jgi:hypothetical protein